MSPNRRRLLPNLSLALLTSLLAAGPAAAERYAVTAGDSWVLAVTGKAGLLGVFGHRHSVLGTEVEGEICFDPQAPGETRARVAVPTAALAIDDRRGRQLAGIGKGPGADDVEEIQADMLSEPYLAAEQHPEIVFELKSAEPGDDDGYVASGSFELRGVARQVKVPVVVERGDDGGLVVSGGFTVKQTDHGIEPASVAGVVKVADEVEVRVRLVGRATGGRCNR